MMKLLTAHSLTVRDAFQPESMALNLTERQSTATVTVGPGAPEISVGDWIQDDTEPGKGIVWRVKTVDTQYETGTRTIQLEHLIMALKDMLMFGEVKPTDMGGTSSGCTAQQAITYILNRQSDWILGTFSYTSVSNPYTFNGDDLLSALETVSSSLEDCWWSYDFYSYPFSLNITARSETVGTELRMARNIQGARHSVDRSRMYTRLYPIGKNNLHIDGDYVSKNESLYGTICKTETDQSIGSKDELLRWANERIANHCEPAVTVTVQALDLSDATGEDLDALTLGAVCRMPIPGLPSPIQETITKISWQNKIAEPRRATVTLANIQEDVASIVNKLIKSGGGGGRASALNAEEDHAWFVDTTDHVAMIAEGVAGEGASTDWSRVSQLLVDGNGIHQRVQAAQADIVTAFSTIDATEDRIMLAVQNDVDGLHSEITQSAGEIQSLVESTLDDFYTQIIQEASQIVIRTGDNTKTFKGLTEPQGTQQDPLVDGDLWFETDGTITWGDADSGTWLEDAGKDWGSAIAPKAHRYNGTAGVWERVMDAQAVLQDTRFQENKQAIRLMAGRVDVVDGEAQRHYAELSVRADQITSTVNDYYHGLSSSITQTASQIRAEVTDSVNGLSSSITQTAGQIRSEVNNKVTQINSSITQLSDQIALVVDGDGIKPAAIIASINNGASNIKLSADHIDIDGVVTALGAKDIGCGSLTVEGYAEFYRTVEIGQGISFDSGAKMQIGNGDMKVGSYDVTWKSKSVRFCSVGPQFTVLDRNGVGRTGHLVIEYTDSTIYYLGR